MKTLKEINSLCSFSLKPTKSSPGLFNSETKLLWNHYHSHWRADLGFPLKLCYHSVTCSPRWRCSGFFAISWMCPTYWCSSGLTHALKVCLELSFPSCVIHHTCQKPSLLTLTPLTSCLIAHHRSSVCLFPVCLRLETTLFASKDCFAHHFISSREIWHQAGTQ